MKTQITLKQLETLYWIAELGTFDRAAGRLFTTQSAVSKRVQELERGAQIELFDRSQRGAKLTAKGEELLEVAKQMLTLEEKIEQLRLGENNPPRQLRIGITELTSITWFPKLAVALKARFPNIKIATKVGMNRDLFNDLQQQHLDLIIVPESFSLPDLVSLPIANVRNFWMAKAGFVDTSKPKKHADICAYPVLVQGYWSRSEKWLDRWLKDRGFIFQDALACDSMTALLGLTTAGLGVTYLPECFRKSYVETGKLEIIETDVPLPHVPYVAIYRENRPQSFIQEVAEIVSENCDFSQLNYV